VITTSQIRGRLQPYVPRLTFDWLADDPDRRWRSLDGSVVFVDISGFTKLSEKLAKAGKVGAEQMADAINHCFTELLAIAYNEDGSLLKFGGDALFLLFTGGSPEDHALRAARAAGGMRKRLRELTATLLTAEARGRVGTPPGAVLTFHDITERRRLERIRRDFVANASHELRTPLTSIRGFVEALEDGAVGDPETAARFLGKIHTHADRMAALVEDLLELSRLESGERPPQWEEIPPGEIVEDVAASFAAAAARKEIVLAKADHAAPPVTTDADRLRRIVENLVDNAIKYTPSGGHVEISSRPGPNGGALLQVKDDGPGIGAEHLPRIFERFYRVDKARSRELGGTGLGLSIVKHLAEGMGATVGVESEPGKGTTFTVTVPARHEGA